VAYLKATQSAVYILFVLCAKLHCMRFDILQLDWRITFSSRIPVRDTIVIGQLKNACVSATLSEIVAIKWPASFFNSR
jgi:hypothetical protein